MPARSVLLGTAAAVLVATTACSSSAVQGTGTPQAPVSPVSSSSPGPLPTASLTVSPPLTTTPALSSSPVFPSSPAITSSSPAPVLSSVAGPMPTTGRHPYSINHLSYRVPAGYVKSHLYHPVRPLTTTYQAYYAVPAANPNGHTVLSLLFYKFSEPIPRGTLAEQKARVRGYNHEARARLRGPIRLVSVDGHPAFGEVLFEPPNFHYLSFFVFGHQQVLQVSCQGDLQSKSLLHSCKTWVDSIKFR